MFDFSCSGFVLFVFLGFLWLVWSVTSVAKDVAQSETAKEIGKGVLEEWILSWFRD
jgi:hypothetical protein